MRTKMARNNDNWLLITENTPESVVADINSQSVDQKLTKAVSGHA